MDDLPRRNEYQVEAARAILVVDDEDAILQIVQTVLQGEGYVVLGATDGAEALDLVRATPPALILLDMRMPNMNGRQFAQAYRMLPGPHAPVIVMTAAHDAAKVHSEVVADDCLAKPFDIDDLIDVVARHMNGTH